jgi:hypothetical protein
MLSQSGFMPGFWRFNACCMIGKADHVTNAKDTPADTDITPATNATTTNSPAKKKKKRAGPRFTQKRKSYADVD